MSDKKSVLSQARADGYDQGYLSGRQIHSLEIDEAFQQGVESVKVPSRVPSFFLGWTSSIVLFMILTAIGS